MHYVRGQTAQLNLGETNYDCLQELRDDAVADIRLHDVKQRSVKSHELQNMYTTFIKIIILSVCFVYLKSLLCRVNE